MDKKENSTSSTPLGNQPTPPQISFQVAAEWTANWRTLYPGKTQAQCFTLNEIAQVTNVNGAVGVRAYYGMKEVEGKSEKEYILKLFLVAVDVNGNDILPETGVIVDFARPCPSYCGDTNILNSGLPFME